MLKKNVYLYIIVIFIFFSEFNLAAAKYSEKDYMWLIKKHAKAKQLDKLNKTLISFFKQYPNSKYIADMRLIAAVYEPDPEQAIKKFNIII